MDLPTANRIYPIPRILITALLSFISVAGCRRGPAPQLLFEGVGAGDLEKVEILLDQGVDVNAHESEYRYTPVHIAVGRDDKEMISLLLNNGADISARMEYGWSATDFAATKDGTETLQFLLEHGAGINDGVDTYYGTPLLRLLRISIDPPLEVVRFLLSNGANVNGGTDSGYTPLHAAVDRKHEDVVKILLEHGADIDAICIDDYSSGTPLELARRKGYHQIESYILSAEENQSTTEEERTTSRGQRRRPRFTPKSDGKPWHLL